MKYESFEPSGSFFMLNENTMLGQGDCLELLKTIPDSSVDMILCDLPYGTTKNKWDALIDLNLMWCELDRVCKTNAAKLFFAQTPFDKVLGLSNIQELRYEWIWEKESGTGFLNSKKMPLKNHENILAFYKKLPYYNPIMRKGFKSYTCKQGSGSDSWNYNKDSGGYISQSNGDRYPISVLRFGRDREKLHPTQKPVALLEYLIKTYTQENETVLDFTMGSGSTGVAAKNLNRKFIGIELDQNYFEIAKKRIQES